ncbi:MAG: GAF domain-containing protein [Clostridia bacterium]|nr:GAF domain-containing protein [Clostridia bacterium]
MTDYISLCDSLKSLISGVPHIQANLANAAALLYNELPDLNWAGFYLFDGETLVLNSFQGKPACIEIPLSRGVCGAAASGKETLVVPDVHAFSGHIACDDASNSEIVIPLIVLGELFGVLDIDSPLFGRFDENDKSGLERFAKILCAEIEKTEKETKK